MFFYIMMNVYLLLLSLCSINTYIYVYILICAHIMRVCIYKFNSMFHYICIYIYMLGAFEILVGDLFVNAAKLARTNHL